MRFQISPQQHGQDYRSSSRRCFEWNFDDCPSLAFSWKQGPCIDQLQLIHQAMEVTQTIFYSWQSDISTCRKIIDQALEQSIPALAQKSVVFSPSRVDNAADGLSGTPSIPEAIFQKLTTCAVAVFDVTPVGTGPEGRALPNPNVLIELGYAAHGLGWGRIILVMDTSQHSLEDIPFDIRHHRFPIAFDTSKKSKAACIEFLTKKFSEFVPLALAEPHNQVLRIRDRLSSQSLALIDAHKNMHDGFATTDQAIEKLLDLGLVKSHFHAPTKVFTYFWTFLGRLLLRDDFDVAL